MTSVGCLGRINFDSLWWFSSIFEVKWIWNLLRNIRDIVSFYNTRCSNTESLYGKFVCTELTGGFVSLYITRSSNTKSLYDKSVCEELTWKICFLIYHAVIEHRAGMREDISCWHGWLFWYQNNHLSPSFYCLFNVFPFGDHSWSSGHLPHIYHLIILKQNSRESPGVREWVECFVSFWVYIYTLLRGVHTVFYKPCWWVYMIEWTL